MKKTTSITLAALTALTMSALAGTQDVILEDANSTASFASDNQYSWTVDGVNHLYAQEFYFRRSGFNNEQNLNTMTLLGQSVIDTNPFSDDNLDTLTSLYSDNNGLEIETLFRLRGGQPGTGISSIAEQITLTNTSTSTISVSFFQFVDFDLDDTAGGDSGTILDGNIAQQWSENFTVSEVVVTPAPTLFQMGDSEDISNLWSNGVIDDLNGDDSYSGDVAWAFQWNITLEAGDSFLISKNKSIGVPTPGSLALLASAGLLATRRRRA